MRILHENEYLFFHRRIPKSPPPPPTLPPRSRTKTWTFRRTATSLERIGNGCVMERNESRKHRYYASCRKCFDGFEHILTHRAIDKMNTTIVISNNRRNIDVRWIIIIGRYPNTFRTFGIKFRQVCCTTNLNSLIQN